MRLVTLATSCALLAACFSKPPNETGGELLGPGAPALIATGNKHACRIDSLTRMICWGNNDHGQLGDRDLAGAGWTGDPGLAFEFNTNAVGWTTVAAGYQHTCGIRDGILYCWGENFYGQVNPASTDANLPITAVEIPGTVEKVFAGGFATCAINADREAYCWGEVNFNTGTPLRAQVTRLGKTTFTQIAITEDHACAIADGGGGTPGPIYCWGKGEQLQLGRSSTDDLSFSQVGLIENAPALFTSVAAGYEATCAITTEQKLVCWGSANHGHLGNVGSAKSYLIIDESRPWTKAAVGTDHVCAISEENVFCYGKAQLGALGSGRFEGNVAIEGSVMTGAVQVTANVDYGCALGTDGTTTRCWGSNSKGELGNHKSSLKAAPTQVKLPDGVVVQQLVAGDHHTCALVGGVAYCWGRNDGGQIGAMSTAAWHAIPIEAAPGTTFTELTAGGRHTCGITTDGTQIKCWGLNADYQLGTTTPSRQVNTVPLPTTPAGITGWTHVSAGSSATCAIANNGDLFCWGLRPGTTTRSAMPVLYDRLLLNRPWRSISVGDGFAVGVAIDTNNFPHVSSFADTPARGCFAGVVIPGNTGKSPVELVPNVDLGMTLPQVAAAQNAGRHTCVQRTTTTSNQLVTCFGDNSQGQLGTLPDPACGSGADVASPPAGWSAPSSMGQRIFTASDQSCALDTQNQIYCWGQNSNKELGNTTPGPTPTLVNTRSWTAIVGGFDHTCGLEANGNVYCWSENQYGQIGDDTSYEPSPVVSGVYP